MEEKEKNEQSQKLFMVKNKVKHISGEADEALAELISYTVELEGKPKVYAKVSYYVQLTEDYLLKLTMNDGSNVRTINCIDT
jgi:hypothetical protein